MKLDLEPVPAPHPRPVAGCEALRHDTLKTGGGDLREEGPPGPAHGPGAGEVGDLHKGGVAADPALFEGQPSEILPVQPEEVEGHVGHGVVGEGLCGRAHDAEPVLQA